MKYCLNWNKQFQNKKISNKPALDRFRGDMIPNTLRNGIIFRAKSLNKYKFKFIKKSFKNHTINDIPLLAVSYSYSRRAVA